MRTVAILMLCGVLLSPAASASIVNNSTTAPTSEDSLSFVFYSLDSCGNPTTADSVFILTIAPAGQAAYKDSVTISDSRVSSVTVKGKQFYTFADQVSNIDGPGQPGHYTITLLTKNNSTGLLTPNTFTFQIIADELSDQIARIDDSVLVKGGSVDSNRTERGSVVDSASVAAWVWNTPQGNHTGNGTFGKYLDMEVSGISGGSGAFAYTLIAFDTSLNQVIPRTHLAIRNITQSALIASGGTGTDGAVAFNLDADSFIVVATAIGYIFDTYDTLVVTGAGTDTIYGDRFDPGSPDSPTLCRVYGYVFDISGQPEAGATVSAHLPQGAVQFSTAIVSPFAVSTQTDSSGYFYLDLVPSDSLAPTGTKYEFTVARTDGTILRQRTTVPDSSSWLLTW